MPSFNAIGNGRFSSALSRLFWMKQARAAAPTLAPEIAPSLDVNQMDDPSLHFIRQEKLCGSAFAIAAGGAGTTSKYALNNPAGSGVLVIVQELQLASITVAVWNVKLQQNFAGLAGTPVQPVTLDTRWWSATNVLRPTARLNTSNDATTLAGDVVAKVICGATSDDAMRFPVNYVIKPGDALSVECTSLNVTIEACGLRWLERAIAAEELSTG